MTDVINTQETTPQSSSHGYGKDIGFILLFIFIVLGCIVLYFVNKKLMIQSVTPYIPGLTQPTPTVSL